MQIVGFCPYGYDGSLVTVEVDIRRGIPGTEIVGLPDSSVREARERVRVAIKNSQFTYPSDRVLVNLAPADLRKPGASFDLPIAFAVLAASRQLPLSDTAKTLVLGELQLNGTVRPVRGVLAAVARAGSEGIDRCIVPDANLNEARLGGHPGVVGIETLADLPSVLHLMQIERVGAPHERDPGRRSLEKVQTGAFSFGYDFRELRGHALARRALEVSAVGAHSVMLFGPPGGGKTMSAWRLPSILPQLTHAEAVEVSRIHSLAGALPAGQGLITRRPFRAPHHGASTEGLIGGGRALLPGEISLAHRGVLFLDEAPEFDRNALQALREPLERREVRITRADRRYRYPAASQLVLATNLCPCGKLGSYDTECFCSNAELHRYWKKLGAALLDRIEIRIPIGIPDAPELVGSDAESSAVIRARVQRAVDFGMARHKDEALLRNSELGAAGVRRYCRMGTAAGESYLHAVQTLRLSARAAETVLKLARSVADLAGEDKIATSHLLEAVQYRRAGESEEFWESLSRTA